MSSEIIVSERVVHVVARHVEIVAGLPEEVELYLIPSRYVNGITGAATRSQALTEDLALADLGDDAWRGIVRSEWRGMQGVSGAVQQTVRFSDEVGRWATASASSGVLGVAEDLTASQHGECPIIAIVKQLEHRRRLAVDILTKSGLVHDLARAFHYVSQRVRLSYGIEPLVVVIAVTSAFLVFNHTARS